MSKQPRYVNLHRHKCKKHGILKAGEYNPNANVIHMGNGVVVCRKCYEEFLTENFGTDVVRILEDEVSDYTEN